MNTFMKRTLGCVVGVTLLLCVPAFAHPPVTVYVDGQAVAFDQPPVIIDDRTLVPMRAIFQAMGSQITWSEPTQTVTSIRGSDTVVLKIGDTGVYKNGTLVYTMPVPARIINERTLVPIRAVAVAFDAAVEWDGIGYVVTITSQGGNSEIQSGGYTAEVKAEDGTTVLSAKISLPKIAGTQGSVIEKEISEAASRVGEDFIQEYGEAAKTAYEKAKAEGKSFSPYYLEGSYEITREDSQYVSVYGTFTQQVEDGKNKKWADGQTYAIQSGKKVAAEDIVSDSASEIEDFLEMSFGALIEENPKSFYDDAKKKLEKSLEDVGFYLTQQGLGFYLQPETIAPKEAGVVGFTVEYKI